MGQSKQASIGPEGQYWPRYTKCTHVHSLTLSRSSGMSCVFTGHILVQTYLTLEIQPSSMELARLASFLSIMYVTVIAESTLSLPHSLTHSSTDTCAQDRAVARIILLCKHILHREPYLTADSLRLRICHRLVDHHRAMYGTDQQHSALALLHHRHSRGSCICCSLRAVWNQPPLSRLVPLHRARVSYPIGQHCHLCARLRFDHLASGHRYAARVPLHRRSNSRTHPRATARVCEKVSDTLRA